MAGPNGPVPRVSDSNKWFHSRIAGKEAEKLLKTNGQVGSFLVRESKSKPGNYTMSVRRQKDIIHVPIQNNGDYFDVSTGSEFASLTELVLYYTEQGNLLTEVNGNVIEAKFPLFNSEPPSSDPWYHGNLRTKFAENLLKDQKTLYSFLVRDRTNNPGEFVLCVLTGKDVVKNIIILCKNGEYSIKADTVKNVFNSLKELIEFYKTTPIVEGTGQEILLHTPVAVSAVSTTKNNTKGPPTPEAEPQPKPLDRHLVEFEDLQKQEHLNKSPRTEGQKPENKEKNRYKNILPFDKTRVILNDPGACSYINANYIKMVGNRLSFIATQGCLAATVPDFWRMVWQEKSQIIAMITKLVEQGKNKCTKYWPEVPDKPLVIDIPGGRIIVSFVKSEMSPTKDFEKREFLLIRESEDPNQPGEYEEVGRRKVCQYNFTAWPDKSVPKTPQSLLQMLSQISEHQRSIRDVGPIIVHCSAGIGRTGTFIVLGLIMDDLQCKGLQINVNIKDIVAEIRKQRSGMVQTELQYKFIYDTKEYYIKNSTNLKHDDSVYANFEG